MLDVRFALRTLRKSPGFTAVAILTLGLGIGRTRLSSARLNPFSSDSSSLTAIPIASSRWHRSIRLSQASKARKRGRRQNGAPAVFLSIACLCMTMHSARLSKTGRPKCCAACVSASSSSIRSACACSSGRTFLPDEDRSRANVIIFSHDLWIRRFGAEPDVVGRVVQLNEEPYRVIGVLPATFGQLRMTNRAEIPQIFMPLGYAPAQASSCRGCLSLNAIGRLKPEVSVSAARSEMNGIMRDIMRDYPGQ